MSEDKDKIDYLKKLGMDNNPNDLQPKIDSKSIKMFTVEQAKENYLKDINICTIINSISTLIEKESLNRREIQLNFSYMHFYIFNIIKKYLDYEKMSIRQLFVNEELTQHLFLKDDLILKDRNFINSLILDDEGENLDFIHLYKSIVFNEDLRFLNENYIQFFLEISPIFHNVYYGKTIECFKNIKNLLVTKYNYNCLFTDNIANNIKCVKFTKNKEVKTLYFNFTIKW